MQWLLGLFLSRALFEARTLAAQAELHNVLRVHVLGAVLDNPFHIASLRTDEPSCNLEVLIIGNLDVEPAGVLDGLVVSVSTEVVQVYLLWHHKRLRLGARIEDILVVEHGLRLSWLELGRSGVLARLAVKRRVFFCLFLPGVELRLQLFRLSDRLELLFARDPLHEQVDIVLLQVNVVERLLGVEGAHDVLKRDQSVLLLSENPDVLKFSEHPENLHRLS